MFKRLRWLLVGYILGLSTAYVVQVRARRAIQRYAPPEVRDRLEAQIESLRGDVRAALHEGRQAMRRRESELRTTWSDAAEAG